LANLETPRIFQGSGRDVALARLRRSQGLLRVLPGLPDDWGSDRVNRIGPGIAIGLLCQADIDQRKHLERAPHKRPRFAGSPGVKLGRLYPVLIGSRHVRPESKWCVWQGNDQKMEEFQPEL
jgi:hypothetical protein